MSPENMGRLNCSSNSIRLPLWEEEVVCNCMKCENGVHSAEGKYTVVLFFFFKPIIVKQQHRHTEKDGSLLDFCLNSFSTC